MEIEYLLEGIFCCIYVILSIILFLHIISIYFKHKQKIFLYIGFGWLGLVLSYVPLAFHFLFFLIFNKPFNQVISLSFWGLLPIAMVLWLVGMKDLLVIKRKIILVILSLYCIFLSIIYFLFLVINPNWIGVFTDKYHMRMNFTIYGRLFFISLLIICLSTGLLFCFQCFKSDNVETKLKGKILLIGFVSWCVGSLITSGNVDSVIIVAIAMIILASASIEFYCGFMMPDWVKKRFLRT